MKDFCSHFGFRSRPFTREYSVAERFSLPMFNEAIDALVHAVEQRTSAVLIAPAGTGKSSVLRAVQSRLPDARYRVSYIKVACLAKQFMLQEIACAIGCDPIGTFPKLFRRIQEHFIQLVDISSLRPVLLIDECHELRPEVLSMLKLLTNFEMDSRLLVSLILCGQSRLKKLLSGEEMEDIAKRLSHYASLRVLSRTESKQYITHRCTIAGISTLPFDEPALDTIFEMARGNLRATDCLALKSLELAHAADLQTVSTNHVIEGRKLLWP